MKSAKLSDYRRHLESRSQSWKIRLQRLSFDNVTGLGTAEFPIALPAAILSGVNGTGKTAILTSLAMMMGVKTPAIIDTADHRLANGSVTCDMIIDGQAKSFSIQFPYTKDAISGNHDITVVHLDASHEVRTHQSAFRRFQNVEDILNGESSRIIDDKRLLELNYINKRDYRRVEVTEIETDGNAIPFFQVTYGNDSYDSRVMGLGELTCFYIWWVLDRSERNSLLIIEEPETFLSPASQSAMADYLLSCTVQKHLTCVISSHSAAVLERFPDACLIYLSREASGVRAVMDKTPPSLLESLGIKPNLEAILFVEDVAAKALLRSLLERKDAYGSRKIDISVQGGEGEITNALRCVSNGKRLRFVGAFDGDQEGKIPEDIRSRSILLPESTSFESALKELVTAKPELIGISFGVEQPSVLLTSLEGLEIHDWYAKLCLELSVGRDALFQVLASHWFQQPGKSELADKVFQALQHLLGETLT